MNGIQGLEIKVFSAEGGDALSPDDHGYLGDLKPGSYRLAVVVPAEVEGNTVAFILEGYGSQVAALKNKATGEFLEKGGKVFARSITIRQDPESGNEYPITFSTENNIRVARIFEGGRFELHELALIGQKGRFYLWAQLYATGLAYKDQHQVVIPTLVKWEGIHRLVADKFGDRIVRDLPFLAEWEEPVPDQTQLAENQGRVLWFSGASGTGAAVLSDGTQARVYWMEVMPRVKDGLSYLLPGEIIHFQEKIPPDAGSRSTTFKWELKGVEVAS